MRYIGSKLSLLDFLHEKITEVAGKDNNKIFADLFAGSGAVSLKFRELGYKVIANDIQHYSYIVLKNLIEGDKTSEIPEAILKQLENIKKEDGFVYNNYCPSKTGRLYFSDENGKKAGAIRMETEKLFYEGKINKKQYYMLISMLINALDECANTTGVYGAYLKELKNSAKKELKLKKIKIPETITGKVYNLKVEDLILQIEGDILYLDPPYNSRQYSSNYHLLETVSKYDEPNLKGLTGLRDDSFKSDFCSKKKAAGALEMVIKNAKFKYIFLSYNNEGIISLKEIKKIFQKYGKYFYFVKEYRRYKADKEEARNHKANFVYEYLHCLIKDV